MDADPSCIFCKICRHEIPAKVIEEDESIIAFHDVSPKAPTHVLVIPKKHIASVNELDEKTAPLVSEMVLVAKRLAKKLNISDSGYRLVMNTGSEAGQSVFHLHLHLIGGRAMQWPPG